MTREEAAQEILQFEQSMVEWASVDWWYHGGRIHWLKGLGRYSFSFETDQEKIDAYQQGYSDEQADWQE